MYRNRMASQHDFAMIPRADIPRSTYLLQQGRKQTFNAGQLIPIYCEEILPGDHFRGESTLFARFATPITAVLDNAEIETFFFFTPNRLVWDNWEAFIGGEDFTVPQIESPTGGFAALSVYDQLGIPCAGQIDPAEIISINALPLRGYSLIFNEWFRDQNLLAPLTVPTDDGPDASTTYALLRRAKKHDYFTSCLPWPQKGTAVDLPLGISAPVGYDPTITTGNSVLVGKFGTTSTAKQIVSNTAGLGTTWGADAVNDTDLFADLSNATAATINQLRLAFQIQRLLERDARGGTRYIELLQAHFGVRPPDFRLQRPEYIGGGKQMVNTQPIPQTSSTDATTPQGNLAGYTTSTGRHRFSYAATEHGYILGLAHVRTDLTYQQGLRRHWRRESRYDFYFPAFAHLGEQAVQNQEIYCTGINADDIDVFGYQERWAEYRYTPNEITGLFRSTTPNNIDVWHYAEEFATLPALNWTFVADPSADTLQRSMAVGADADGQQILLDVLHTVRATRPMPTYSAPGLIDHF